MPETIRLLSVKDDLGATLVERTPRRDLIDGQLRLGIDSFALTTNNITYATYGSTIGYWRVFPTSDDKLGAMPVWGFADVVESRVATVPVGTRVWGFLPIANELIVDATAVTPRMFFDSAAHRQTVPEIYNRYLRCEGDPFYRAEFEAQQSLYRPLFMTSYTAVDDLAAADFHGARRILISSASSKTAYSLAWCARDKGLELIAITSKRNRDFVDSLGAYDSVIAYDEVETLPAAGAILYADFAGEAALRSRVHHHFGNALVHDMLVGSTQSTELAPDRGLPGPAPSFFFAATRLDEHRRQGTIHVFMERFERDQQAFFSHVATAAPPWVRIEHRQGIDCVADVVRDLGLGRVDPRDGNIARL